jgi:hypothetical protein
MVTIPVTNSDPQSARRLATKRIATEWAVNREQSRSLPRSRLLVTYLDRDMELVWTPKHFDKNELAPEFVGSN